MFDKSKLNQNKPNSRVRLDGMQNTYWKRQFFLFVVLNFISSLSLSICLLPTNHSFTTMNALFVCLHKNAIVYTLKYIMAKYQHNFYNMLTLLIVFIVGFFFRVHDLWASVCATMLQTGWDKKIYSFDMFKIAVIKSYLRLWDRHFFKRRKI